MNLPSISVTFIYLLPVYLKTLIAMNQSKLFSCVSFQHRFLLLKKCSIKVLLAFFKIAKYHEFGFHFPLLFPHATYPSSSLLAAAAQVFANSITNPNIEFLQNCKNSPLSNSDAASKSQLINLSSQIKEKELTRLFSSLIFIEDPIHIVISNSMMTLIQSGAISNEVIITALNQCSNGTYVLSCVKIAELMNNI